MKAALSLELFGENVRQYQLLYRGIFQLFGFEKLFDSQIGVRPRSSWVAEVTGPDEKYRLKREFLRPKLDYSRANSKGSRGIFAEYILETGKLYEVKSQVTWNRVEQYFCIVNDQGDIEEIDEEIACHSVGAETYEERRERFHAERISGNKRS